MVMARKEICLLLVFVMLLKQTRASGKFELQVLKVQNGRNEKANGECCDSSGERNAEGICKLPCVSKIKVCLKEYQSVTRSSDYPVDIMCKLGNASSGVFNEAELLGSVDHPVVHLVLPFDFAWTVSIHNQFQFT